MRARSIVSEGRQIRLASELVRMGARLQLLEAEIGLSREKLLRLYKEVKGASPPKGMLPFSTDWFMTWQPNVHASLFMSFYRFLLDHTPARGLDALIKAYRLYQEHVAHNESEPVLTLTRAWTLVRFFEAKMLQLARCTCCGGNFVAHAYDLTQNYACGLCHVPARAGKARRAAPVEQTVDARLNSATNLDTLAIIV